MSEQEKRSKEVDEYISNPPHETRQALEELQAISINEVRKLLDD